MSENFFAVAHACRNRHPSTGEATFEQFISGRLGGPERHGSDSADSVRIKDEKEIRRRFQYHIVGELILRDDARDFNRRLTSEGPAHHLFERAVIFDFVENFVIHSYDTLRSLADSFSLQLPDMFFPGIVCCPANQFLLTVEHGLKPQTAKAFATSSARNHID